MLVMSQLPIQIRNIFQFFDVPLYPPTLKLVLPRMRRLLLKKMFSTWMKTLLNCGYEYVLNLLVTLAVTYKT